MVSEIKRIIQVTLFLAAAFSMRPSLACSRILWNDNGKTVVVGRTMDWPGSTEPELIAFPRGLTRDGGALGTVRVVQENPLKWTSRYGSLVTAMYGLGAADGINERGLAAHLQYFSSADYGVRDPSKPGLQAGLWAQYVLDRAATVREALEALEGVQLVMAEARGATTSLHLAIEDASGDSAIIEFIEGRMVVHHGRQYKVMTNDPPYDQQIALLKGADFKVKDAVASFSGLSPTDRFLRASYGLSLLDEPRSEREAVSDVLEVTRQVSVPVGTPSPMGLFQTEYRTVADLAGRLYYFELTGGKDLFWMDLSKFNLEAGAPVMTLKPDSLLAGDSTARFRAIPQPF